jgi:large subunit ribosomal protein L15
MPHRLRKTRKRRGSRTQGWGKVGQHRRRGGKGRRKPGRHKALWSYVIRYEPDYYGKNGFTSPRSVGQITRTINVGRLEIIANTLSVEKGEKRALIDLGRLGYTKLLGAGKVTRPIVVRIPSCSKSAAEKIQKAGGRVLAGVQEVEE